MACNSKYIAIALQGGELEVMERFNKDRVCKVKVDESNSALIEDIVITDS